MTVGTEPSSPSTIPGEADYPYPGLRPYGSNESNIFFGRKKHVTDLLTRLNSVRFLAVVGPSGCGKSSLIRAGLIPALEGGFMAGSRFHWNVAVMRPGNQPMRRLAESLRASGIFGEPEGAETPSAERLTKDLERGPRSLAELLQFNEGAGATNLLVLVDQFEEIFRFERTGGAEESRAFINLLLASARAQDVAAYVVITMRTDFLGQCPAFHGLPEALNEGQYLTPRLNRDELQLAIEGPARMFACEVELEVISRILNEMGTNPDQLPLMQHLLMRMWRDAQFRASEQGEPDSTQMKRPSFEVNTSTNVRLGMAEYRKAGELAGALRLHAERVYSARLTTDRQRWLAEQLFRRLTDVAPDGQMIRRTPVPQFGTLVQEMDVNPRELAQVIDSFRAEGRSFLMPPPSEPLEPTTPIDISHESLIRQWDRLQDWTKDEAKSELVRKRVTTAAETWQEAGCGQTEAVLSPSRLAEALEWSENHPGDISPLVKDFLGTCERKRVSAARQGLRRKFYFALSAVAGVFGIVAGFLFVQLELKNLQLVNNDRERKEDQIYQEALQAALQRESKEDYATALLWWNQGLKEGRQGSERRALNQLRIGTTLAQNAKLSLLMNHFDLNFVNFHPAGRYALTAGGEHETNQKGTIRIWDTTDTTTDKLRLTVTHDYPVHYAYWIDNGRRIVAATGDKKKTTGHLALWEITKQNLEEQKTLNPPKIWPLPGSAMEVEPCLLPDQPLVAAIVVGSGRTDDVGDVYLWNWRDDRTKPWRLETSDNKPVTAAHVKFSPDGRYLVFTGDKSTSIWDIAAKKLLSIDAALDTQQKAHLTTTKRVAFSPDGTKLLTAGGDGLAVLWSVAPETMALSMLGWVAHTESVENVAFSSTNATLRFVTASQDNTAQIWSMHKSTSIDGHPLNRIELVATLRHENWVNVARFSPDGRYVVTASRDQTVRVWNASSGKLAYPIMQHGYGVSYVEFDPSSTHVLTYTLNTARVWELATGNSPPAQLDSKFEQVWHASGSADGRFFVIANRQKDGSAAGVSVWDVAKNPRACLGRFGSADNVANAWVGQADKKAKWLLTASDSSESAQTGGKQPQARLWDITADMLSAKQDVFPDESWPVKCAAFSDDGRFLATATGSESEAGAKWKIQLWNLSETPPFRADSKDVPGPVNYLVFGAKGDAAKTAFLAAVGRWEGNPREKWRLWTVDKDQLGSETAPKHNPQTTFSSDAPTALAGHKSTGYFEHNPPTSSPTDAIVYAAFDRNCGILATASEDDTAQLWNIATGEPIGGWLRHTSNVTHLVFSGDGSRLATSGFDGKTRMWDVSQVRASIVEPSNQEDDVKPMFTLEHGGRVNRAAFSADSSYLATASYDGSAKVWNSANGELAATFQVGGDVLTVWFDREFSRLITISGTRSVGDRTYDDGSTALPQRKVTDRGEAVPQTIYRHEWNLSAITQDRETLTAWAEILGARRLDKNALTPLPTEEINKLWEKHGPGLRDFFLLKNQERNQRAHGLE